MILSAENIEVSFRKERQTCIFGRERQQVVRDVSLEIERGECFALVGESGSGKSTLGRVLCGLQRPEVGRVMIDGLDLYGRHSVAERKRLRHKISIVFQDYTTSVNPRFRVREIVGESLRALAIAGKPVDREKRTAELLEMVGLDRTHADRYPHELSGGQLQRVCIARAVAIEPEIIVLDEAISSLDASTQVQVMDLLIELRNEQRFSYLFITHDLTAVTYMCDRVAFFAGGRIVEMVEDMARLSRVKSEYARRLLDSVIGIEGMEDDVEKKAG